MENRKILFLNVFFSVCSLFITNIQAQDWVPLEIGNKWQYFDQIYYYSTPWPSITNVEVNRDTILSNKTFYWIKSVREGWWPYTDSTLQRYDLDDKILYKYYLMGDSEYVLMDFNLEAGDTLPFIPPSYSYRTVIAGSDYLFGNSILYKGYKELFELYLGNYSILKFSEDFGHYYSYGFNRVPGIGEYDSDSQLIQSIIKINGVFQNHSHQKYPVINFNPVTLVTDSSFQISFIVDHYYSRIYSPYGGNDSLLFNYIDSVFIESYYSNGTTTINELPILVSNLPNEKEYLLDTVLNLNLLTNGYNFYYRIKAVDKGIISHTTFSPGFGYYKIVYDTTTGVNEFDNKPITFQLYQNYPNPFNPVTKIEYSIPNRDNPLQGGARGGLVTLKVYDMLGIEIAVLVNEEKSAGTYEVTWYAENLPSGVYFYQLKAGNYIQTKKLILLK